MFTRGFAKKNKAEKKAKKGKGKAAIAEEVDQEEASEDDADLMEDDGEDITEESVLLNATEKIEKTLEHLNHRYSQLRNGRAMPGMLDNVQVEAYGSTMTLNSIASVSLRGAQMLVVSVHDQSIVNDVETAIRNCGLSLNPQVQANKSINIQIPKLTQEVRKEVSKMVAKHAEEAKQAVRNQRKQILGAVKKNVASEDEQKRIEKAVQSLVDDTIAEVDGLKKHKEKDVEEG